MVWLIIPLYRCPLYTVWSVLHIHDVSVLSYTSQLRPLCHFSLYSCVFVQKNVECRRMSNEMKVERQKFLNRIMTDVPRILVRISECGFWFVIAFRKYLNFTTFWEGFIRRVCWRFLCRILLRRHGRTGEPDSFCDYFCTRFFTVTLIQLLCFSLWYFSLAQYALTDTDEKLTFLFHPSARFSFSWTFLMSHSQAKSSSCDHNASDLRPSWVTGVLHQTTL